MIEHPLRINDLLTLMPLLEKGASIGIALAFADSCTRIER